MVVSPDDLIRDQRYHKNKRRYWTRRLHGWGVVSGLVATKASPEQQSAYGDSTTVLVSITAGDVLDPIGREMTLTSDALVDVAHIDGQGNSIIYQGEGANPAAATAAALPASENHAYLLAIRYHEQKAKFVPSPTGPKPDGSEACEGTVFREGHVFQIFPATPGAAEALAAEDWVVLATVTYPGSFATVKVVDDDKANFPIDPLDAPDDAPDNLVHALAEGHLDRAEAHLSRWKTDIARGIHNLLELPGRIELERTGHHMNLEQVPAKFLKPSEADPVGSERLRDFLVRAESPFLSGRPISVQCVARLSRDKFKERVRFIFRSDEIPDEAIDHAHNAAGLLYAVVRQWPAPSFEGMLTRHGGSPRA
jgi:hypothetical protein